MGKVSNYDILEDAKSFMFWDGYREPTLLEYLRYYKNDSIKEIHILAAIAVHAPAHYLPKSKPSGKSKNDVHPAKKSK